MGNNNILASNPNNASVVTNAKQGFKAFYQSGMSLAKLATGEHDAYLKTSSFVDADPKSKGSKDYVRLELQLADRIIIDNRFETNFGIFESQIKQQLSIEDQAMSIPELLNYLHQHQFKIYVEYVNIPGDPRTFRNVSYLPPLPTQTTAAATEISKEDF